MSRDETDERRGTGAAWAFLEGALENLPEGVLILDTEGRFSYVNTTFLSWVGRTREDLLGKRVGEVDPAIVSVETAAELTERTRRRMVTGEELPGLELDFVGADGAPRIATYAATVVKGEDGEPLGTVVIVVDITVRRNTERALVESEKKFRSIVESSPMGMHLYRLEGDERLVFAGSNPAADALLGVDNSRFMGLGIEEAFPDLADTELPARYRRAAAEGVPWKTEQLEYKDARINGAFEVYAFQTVPGAMATMFLDVTERKRVEEALRESEEKFRSISEQAAIGILIIQDGRVVYANDMAAEINDYSKEEILSWSPEKLLEAVHPEDLPDLIEALIDFDRRGGTAGPIKRFFYRTISRNGQMRWIEQFSQRITFLGRPAILNTVVDVTQRVMAQMEARRLRVLLANIVDSMPSVLVGVDPSGRVNQWNREAERVSGTPAEDAQGRFITDVLPDLADQVDGIEQAIAERRTIIEEKMVRRREGATVLENVTIYPLVSDELTGAVIRIDDVTERARIEEMIIQSEKMLSVGGLAAGMAHEINNPLAGIIQNAQVMRGRLTGDFDRNRRAAEECGTDIETIRAYMESRGVLATIDAVMESGRRAAQIVENMLSFSRKTGATVSTHDLGELLDKTVELASSDYDLKKKYDFRDIEIVRDFADGVPQVSCEGSKIQQVFLNLLRNAAEAMSEAGNEAPRLELGISRREDAVRVEIGDNGPGMTEEVRRRVFEPFYTTKDPGVGTGLGLSVSFFIVTENHGGVMTVESAPGKGARFIVELPLVR